MVQSSRILIAAALLALTVSASANPMSRTDRVRLENQPRADRGDGTYRNPILAGHYHDPSVVRVGGDYYMTHCPDLLVWHSRDLVNWEPIGRVNHGIRGAIWAPDLVHHEGLFYLYLPVRRSGPDQPLQFTNLVLTATDPAGPWSEPVDLGIGGIDPGHVIGPDGRRFLYVNQGRVIELTPDGLGVIGGQREVYAGWPIPEEWIVECRCLESPKFMTREGWIYLISAEGGTAGPSTSHMITVARSRSAEGPWENAPGNPMLRTASRSEPWWSQGHGTLIDAVDGSWWVVYHAIRRHHRSLGRNTLLLPVRWTADGWPVIPDGVAADDVLPKPPGADVGHGLPLSDDFRGPGIGIQWNGTGDENLGVANGVLELQARGDSVRTAAQIHIQPVNTSYEVRVEVELNGAPEGGLLIQGAEAGPTGVFVRPGAIGTYVRGRERSLVETAEGRFFLKLRVIEDDVALYHGTDGEHWTKFEWGSEISSYHALRVALYATGEGSVRFRDFRYRGIPAGDAAGSGFIAREDLYVRDPFVLPVEESGTYHLYATSRDPETNRRGVRVYQSNDLEHWRDGGLVFEIPDGFWADPTHSLWAPEVHRHAGKYYLFATLSNPARKLPAELPDRPDLYLRATGIFVSDSPDGPFLPLSDRPHTPEDWMSLDGTLWVEDDIPHMIFCHEWWQVGDGTFEVVPLLPDLSRPTAPPTTLFRASEGPWTRDMREQARMRGRETWTGRVTDGAFFHRSRTGKLIMLWSSFGENGYACSQAVSESGQLKGPWIQSPEPLYDRNGGHGMLFRTFDDRLLLSLHAPNDHEKARAHFLEVEDLGNALRIIE